MITTSFPDADFPYDITILNDDNIFAIDDTLGFENLQPDISSKIQEFFSAELLVESDIRVTPVIGATEIGIIGFGTAGVNANLYGVNFTGDATAFNSNNAKIHIGLSTILLDIADSQDGLFWDT